MEISSRTATTHKPLRLRGCVAICAAIVVSAFSLSGAATASASAPRAVRLPAATFPVITKSKIKIAIVPGGPNSYWAPGPSAAAAASKLLGVPVSFVVPPTPTFEPAVQISTIDSLVAKGYNGFVINPDGESAMMPTYERLINRGIPIIDIAGCSTPPTPALLCFATDVKGSAKFETQTLIKAMGGKGSIAYLTGLLTDPNTILRVDGVKEAMAASNGQAKLAEIVSNIDSPSLAPPAVESLLAAKGSSIQGMMSTNYYPSVVAVSVLTKDSQFRHVLFIGQDNDPTVMSAIKNHYIYGTMYQNPYGQVYVAAQWIYKILADGCKVSPTAPWLAGASTARFVNSGYFFVGQSNVSQYIGKFETIPSVTSQVLANTSKYLSCP